MVHKSLCRDIFRKCVYSSSDLPEARYLSEPKCQGTTNLWYVVYRWFILLSWVAILVCSLLEIGSYKHHGHRELFLIYLTHWDLLFGFAQSLLGAIITTKRFNLQKSPLFAAERMWPSTLDRFYWVTYTITASMALGVTGCYWGLIHNPEIHVVDPLNIMQHCFNSVLMLTDLFISNVPFRMRSYWWCPVVVIFYSIFTVIYYAAGGLDKKGNHYIYKVLDWQKPERALLVCVGGLLFLVFLHFVLYALTLLRDFVFKRMYIVNVDHNKPDHMATDIVKIKHPEMIV